MFLTPCTWPQILVTWPQNLWPYGHETTEPLILIKLGLCYARLSPPNYDMAGFYCSDFLKNSNDVEGKYIVSEIYIKWALNMRDKADNLRNDIMEKNRIISDCRARATECINLLKSIHFKYTDEAKYHFILADAYFLKGRKEETDFAIAHIDKAIEISSKSDDRSNLSSYNIRKKFMIQSNKAY